MRTIPTITHNGIIYEASLSGDKNILRVVKYMPEGELEREVTFDNLPEKVKEEITKHLNR